MNPIFRHPCASLLLILFLGASSPLQATASEEYQTLVLGAGCFWCVEAFYEALPGVVAVVSGYAGGERPNPTYKDVSAGRTKHAEVVEITFDPSTTSLPTLLDFFWTTHDPTDPTGVWPDFGPQYRSIILYQDEAQKLAIEASQSKFQSTAKTRKPIATQIVPLIEFYPAEDYHQDFVRKNPGHPYVRRIAIPKLKKLGLPVPE
ncbi:MAG: peptide-methionine (S)-S-oxide reductase MsrA [Puniceicoccaceae bacterium]